MKSGILGWKEKVFGIAASFHVPGIISSRVFHKECPGTTDRSVDGDETAEIEAK